MQANFKFTNTGAKFKEVEGWSRRNAIYLIFCQLLRTISYSVINQCGVTIAFKN